MATTHGVATTPSSNTERPQRTSSPPGATTVGPRTSSSSACPVVPSPEAPLSQSLHEHSPPPPDILSLSSSSSSNADSAALEWTFEPSAVNHHVPPQLMTRPLPTSPSLSTSARRNGLVMQVRTQTWIADSHGLYDYESRNVLLNEFKCTCMRESYHISRVGTEIRLLPSNEAKVLYASDAHAKALAHIVWANGHYYLTAPASTAPGNRDEHLWLVVRHLRDRAAIIVPGDTLKLGRFRLKVKEVVMTSQEAKSRRFLCYTDDDDCETVAPEPGDTTAEFDGGDGIMPFGIQHGREHHHLQQQCQRPLLPNIERDPDAAATPVLRSEDMTPSMQENDRVFFGSRTCRICLCEADGTEATELETNPLVAPCECKGSMKWVHLQCLRTWIAGRLNIRSVYKGVSSSSDEEKENNLSSTENTETDMTLTDTSNDAEKGSRTSAHHSLSHCIELFEIPRPDVPYTILEPRTQQNRGLHIVSLANNRVARLGRGHESDIRLADISVSRLHSVLRYQPPSALKRFATSMVGSCGFGVLNKDAISNGCLMVEDNRSKFGTLLELRRPFRLDPSYPPVSIQIGRTVVTISLKRRWRLRMPACIRHHASDIYVVFRQPHPHQHPAAPTTPALTGNNEGADSSGHGGPVLSPTVSVEDVDPQPPLRPRSAVSSQSLFQPSEEVVIDGSDDEDVGDEGQEQRQQPRRGAHFDVYQHQ